MKSLQDFKTLVEEEKSDYSKFDMLIRAGLANKAQIARIHKIMDKMQEERPQFNNADREIMRNLFNKMADLIANNKQIFQKTRQAVREDVEQVEENAPDVTNMPPFVLILKRKAIRYYPNDTRVALYHNQKLDKYFSIPYGTGVDGVIQAEEVEVNEGRYQSWSGPSHGHAYGGSGFGRREREDDEYHNEPPRRPMYPANNPTNKPQPKPEVKKAKPTNEENEQVDEAVMDTLHKIVAGKSAQSVKFANGVSRKVDHYTASAITQVHKAVNDENKKKLADMVHKSPEHFEKVAKFAFSKAK